MLLSISDTRYYVRNFLMSGIVSIKGQVAAEGSRQPIGKLQLLPQIAHIRGRQVGSTRHNRVVRWLEQRKRPRHSGTDAKGGGRGKEKPAGKA